MDRMDWLRSFGLGRDPFDAPEAARDAVLGMAPHGAQHVRYGQVRGAPEVLNSCVIEGESGSGRSTLLMQLAAEDEALAVAHPGIGRRVVTIDRFSSCVGELVERRGRAPDTADLLDLVLHRIVPELVDEVLGVEADDRRPRLPVAHAAAAIEVGGPAAARDLLLLQALYDRAGGALDRTIMLRERFALSGGVRATASGWWGVLLLCAAMLASALLLWAGDRVPDAIARSMPPGNEPWARALPWIGVGLVSSAALGLLGRWAVAGELVRSRVRRARRSIVVTDHAPTEVSACLNELRPADLGFVPRPGALTPRLDLLRRTEDLMRLLGWRSMAVIVDGVEGDEPTRFAVGALLDQRIIQRAATSVVIAVPPGTVVPLRVPCLVVTLDWSPATLRLLLQSRMERCADAPSAAPSFDALFEPAISRDAIDSMLAQWRTPRAALDRMRDLVTTASAASVGGAKPITRKVIERSTQQPSAGVTLPGST